ncbi:MAG: sulfotransferase family protein, partial [Phycisphaerales bacterium]
ADKTPAHAFHLRELADAYPLARFVCCERDPRDTAVSAWMHLHEMHGHRPADDFPSYTRHYVERIWAPATAAGRALLAELGPQRVILAPYERHKRDTHGQLRDLFRFLGLDASDAIVERVAESQSFQRVTNRPPGVEAKDRNRKGVVGDWINHMSPEFGNELLAIADGALGKWKEPPLEASRGSALIDSASAERR